MPPTIEKVEAFLRNVAGFLPHKNDKAAFGNTWRVVIAENEDTVKKIGWTNVTGYPPALLR